MQVQFPKYHCDVWSPLILLPLLDEHLSLSVAIQSVQLSDFYTVAPATCELSCVVSSTTTGRKSPKKPNKKNYWLNGAERTDDVKMISFDLCPIPQRSGIWHSGQAAKFPHYLQRLPCCNHTTCSTEDVQGKPRQSQKENSAVTVQYGTRL